MRREALVTRWLTEADFGEVELQRIVPTSPWPISLMVTQTIRLRDRDEQRTVVIPLNAAQARELASDLVEAAGGARS
jgi:hypothetical protein